MTFLNAGRIDIVDVDDVNYYFIPVIILTLGAYFIADIFFDVYEMAVDTLFLCFLEVKCQKKIFVARYI